MSFSINKLLAMILVVVVVGIVLLFLFKIDLTKYFNFLPNFGDSKKDKVIDGGGELEIGQTETLQEDETCCCLYENMKNTEECKGAKLELNEYCKDKLGDNWVNSDDEYCKK